MTATNPIPEKQVSEFLARLQQAAGSNLESVILYGSAVAGEYHPEHSNFNLLCIFQDTALTKLLAVATAVEWWTKQKHPFPLMFTEVELKRSADVFSIELLDMKQQHRVLLGRDVLASLELPMHWHRAQIEYELEEKLILLRRELLLASGDRQRTWNLLLKSVSAFCTLFRHVLLVQRKPMAASKREAVKALAGSIGCDASAFEQVLDIREKRTDPKSLDVVDVAARYIATVERVAAAVDRMPDAVRN
ncbi:MAG: nucleotidyltransferase domain-containing protein [Terriglobales bacterium]|jgi:hypothetical protein